MQQSEPLSPFAVEGVPVLQSRFEQRIGANDICCDEVAGPVYRAVDMALCGEVDDGIRAKRAESFL
jgi:hypothetical protein